MSLLQIISHSVRERGFSGTVSRVVERSIETASERLYDVRLGVDTSGQVPCTQTSPTTGETGRGYRGTAPGFLRRKIRSLQIPFEESVFVDLGSGKGRTLLLAAEFPFRGIVGVELSDSLHRVAVANVAALGLENRITCLRSDASDYRFPDDALVLFFFNPFPEEVLRQVVQRLGEAWERKPRPIRIIYRKPIWTKALDSAPFLVRIESRRNRIMRDYSYAIYCDAGHAIEDSRRVEAAP
jgi:SAM-dependent methyltransferase